MLELRALSTTGRPATVAMNRPVLTPVGTFSPLPYQPPAGLVLSIHPVETLEPEPPHAAACRSYLSDGLAAPNQVLGPLGWLIDIVA